MSALTGDEMRPVRVPLTPQQVEQRRREAKKILAAARSEQLPVDLHKGS
ncbi:hypothetical protein ACFWUP_16690 [Nocardia sp. NPDC058658]